MIGLSNTQASQEGQGSCLRWLSLRHQKLPMTTAAAIPNTITKTFLIT
jgi:hypothetical protein